VNLRSPTKKATNRKAIPQFVTKQYRGGAKGFKATKRSQLKALRKAFEEFRTGCVWLPCGTGPVNQIFAAICELQEAVSSKSWGH
jgi:hypothetical protein